MKTWPTVLLLCLPALAFSETATESEQKSNSESGAAQEVVNERPYNWVDSSHAYATDQAQALTEWMDSFFNDPNYEFEQPESLLRLEWINSWDENADDRTKLRLRGKVQLPGLSRRLNLVFSGQETGVNNENKDVKGSVGLQFNLREQARSRVDATMGISSSSLTPGVRYRNQGPLGNAFYYRYTQRLEWEDDDEGFYTTGEVNLDQRLADDDLLRWSNRLIYGEDTDGTEWRTNLSLRHRITPKGSDQPFVISYYGTIRGTSDPDITRAYRLGVLMRRQIYRRFLFAEIEPSYAWRKKKPGDDREGGWKFVLRFEIALQRDLRRARPQDLEHGD
jgi:hypothetical protein